MDPMGSGTPNYSNYNNLPSRGEQISPFRTVKRNKSIQSSKYWTKQTKQMKEGAKNERNIVDGSEIRLINQLSLVVYPIIYKAFIHPKW